MHSAGALLARHDPLAGMVTGAIDPGLACWVRGHRGGCAVDGHRDAERSGGCTRVTAHGHGARETTAHQAAVTRASAPSCVLPPTWSQTLGLSARLPASRARDKEGRATVHEHTQRDPKRRARFWWADPMVIAVNALGMTQITAWGTSYYCLGAPREADRRRDRMGNAHGLARLQRRAPRDGRPLAVGRPPPSICVGHAW